MYQKEQQLVSSLLDLGEATTDLKDTLLAINRCLKTRKVPKEEIQIILEMLPDPPFSEHPLHHLPEREAMVVELQNPEGVDEEVLISFRDYFEATQDAYSREYLAIRHNLDELREERDLADLNAWWKQCTAEEREIAFTAIAVATGVKKPERLLATTEPVKRIMLLARGMEAIQKIYVEAANQTSRWKELPEKEKQMLMKSVETHTGMPAKKWWNKATTAERTRVLKQLLDALEASKKQSLQTNKTATNVA